MRRFIYVPIWGEAEKEEGAKYTAALVLYNGYRLGSLTPQEGRRLKDGFSLVWASSRHAADDSRGGAPAWVGGQTEQTLPIRGGLSPYLPQLSPSSSTFSTSSEHFPDYDSPPLDPPHEFSSHVSPLKVVSKFEQSKRVEVRLMRLERRMFSAF